MKIDNNMLEMLKKMPDDKLLQMIKLLSSAKGIELPSGINDPATIASLRKVLNNASAEDINRVLAMYTSGGKNKD